MSIRIENPASPDLIPQTLKPAIERVTGFYQDVFASRLQSVYLLGSAARGEYKSGISDFDLRAIVSDKKEGEKEKVDVMALPMEEEFNLAKMELDVYTETILNNNDWLQFYLLVDGLCVWGVPYKPPIPLPSSKEGIASMLTTHLLKQYQKMPITPEKIKARLEEDNPEAWRQYARRAIRLGNAISIFKTGQYTQNKEKMVENIIRNVPEISEPILRLDVYRNKPPANFKECLEFVNLAEIVRKTIFKYGLNERKV